MCDPYKTDLLENLFLEISFLYFSEFCISEMNQISAIWISLVLMPCHGFVNDRSGSWIGRRHKRDLTSYNRYQNILFENARNSGYHGLS